MRKNIFKILFVVSVLCGILCTKNFIFASFGYGFNPSVIPSGNRVTNLDNTANNIWAMVSLVLKILAVFGIIVTGIKYMFSTFDAKAKIKESLPVLIIGVIIVFAGTTLVDFIIRVFKESMS